MMANPELSDLSNQEIARHLNEKFHKNKLNIEGVEDFVVEMIRQLEVV